MKRNVLRNQQRLSFHAGIVLRVEATRLRDFDWAMFVPLRDWRMGTMPKEI